MRIHDLAEQGLRRPQLAATGEEACQPGACVQERRGAGIVDVEDRDSLAIQAIRFRAIAGLLGNRREVADDLRAHPCDGCNPPVTNAGELRIGGYQRFARTREIALQAQGRAAQLERLSVEDFGNLFREQRVRRAAELLADAELTRLAL